MANLIETMIRSVVGKGIETVASYNRNRRDANHSHPYLVGVHAPVVEERTIEGLAVTGQIPVELSGRYLRIGPNPFRPDPRGHHWFLGDGMVHGIRIRNGKAEWYRNRYIRSRALEAVGGPPAAPGPRRGRSDLVNTNVIAFADKALALVEAGSYPAVLDDELDTLSYENFAGTLTAPFSAHPHFDPETGEWHAITYDAVIPDRVWHVVIDASGKVVRELPIAVEHGPSIHDCTITQRYVIIFDLPVTFSIKALIAGDAFPYQWNPQHRARVGLLPRQGDADQIIWCDVDPCYVFHVVNSYDDEDGRVVIDAAVHESMFSQAIGGPDGRALGLERWHVNPEAGRVDRATIDPAPQEFPRPDERKFGRRYRHAWAIGIVESGFNGAQPLYHHDLETGVRAQRDFGPGHVPGEFVFVPQSDQAPEGVGWLMGLVIDTNNDTTTLFILDPLDIAADPIATVHIPCRIPSGFHGNWIAD